MPVKKTKPMPKSSDKRHTAEDSPTQELRNGQPARAAASGRIASNAGARETGPSQMESFQDGMRLFHARQFQQARECFVRAIGGADRAVAHRAGLHARMCEQRLGSGGVVLNTPEEHYNYAVTLINSRDLTMAQKHLRAALEMDSAADHVLYALAACQSLAGDLQAGYENLKRAIDLQPRNRLAARQDPDFAAMSEHPAFIRLLYPDRKS
jgi:tetratricopeptide (TPR) repeat protein